MDTVTKYLFVGLLALLAIAIFYISIVARQRDGAIDQLDRANSQINRLVDVNKNLNGSIDLLEQQAQQNRDYITNLEQMRVKTQQEADMLIKQFKEKQHSNQTIGSWANQPLPGGLY